MKLHDMPWGQLTWLFEDPDGNINTICCLKKDNKQLNLEVIFWKIIQSLMGI